VIRRDVELRQRGANVKSGIDDALSRARRIGADRVFELARHLTVDRLSWKVRQLAQLAEELDALNVVLRSATEPFDTGSAAGRMMLQMLAVFAEFEHATIVDRVTAGIERRAKEGRWFGGRPPFGYAFSNVERVLVPDPVKAPVVRRVFDLYARKRLGTRTIAQHLARRGRARAVGRVGASGGALDHQQPTYVGKIRWRDKVFDGVHEPIVDEFTFAKAQAILAERGEHARRRGNASDFILPGLLRCGKCGKAYIGISANGNGGRHASRGRRSKRQSSTNSRPFTATSK
jgi:site-specific DNA recombinase